MMKLRLLLIPITIMLIALYSAAYVLDETEQAVIAQFGKAVGETKLHFGNYARLSYPRPRCSPRLLADAPLYQIRKRTSWY